MTSRNLSSNKGLTTYNLKRNLWGIILSLLGFVFTLLVPTLMLNQSDYGRTEQEFFYATIRGIIGGENAAVKLVFVVLAIVCGVAAFRYLHSRQRVDFYHSLPISRGSLFIKNFMSGFLYVIPVYLIVELITITAVYASGFGEAIIWGQLFESILVHIIMFFAIYSLAVLATILCGNTIIALLLQLWIFFVIPAVRLLTQGLYATFFTTYIGERTLSRMVTQFLSPITTYFYLEGWHTQGYSYYGVDQISNSSSYANSIIAYFIIAILVTAVSFWLFNIRKSEKAGTALAFDKIKVPVKVIMCLVAGISVALIFQGATGQNGWFWFGLVAGVVLMHMVVEIIYAFDFRAIFKKTIHMAAILTVAAIAMLSFQFDFLGYNTWIPNKSDIVAMDIDKMGYDEGDLSIAEAEDIEYLYKLAEIGVSEVTSESQLRKMIAEDDRAYSSFTISYQLKNGKQKMRYYSVPVTNEVEELFTKLYSSESYRKAKLLLYTTKVEDIEQLDIYVSSFEYNVNRFVVSKPEQIKALIEILQKEALKRSISAKPVIIMEITSKDGEGKYYGLSELMVTEEDVETLALIKEYAGIEPKEITAEMVDYIEVYDEKTMQATEEFVIVKETSNPVIIRDKGDIKSFLENAVSGGNTYLWETNGWLCDKQTPATINLVTKEQTEYFTIEYAIGETPIEMLKKYDISLYQK